MFRNSVEVMNISDSTIIVGNATLGNVLIDSDSVDIRGGTTVTASFGATTTIGNTSTEHIEITKDHLKLKDGGTEYVKIDSSGLYVDGTISSSLGNIGGWKIGTNSLKSSDDIIVFNPIDQEIMVNKPYAFNSQPGVFIGKYTSLGAGWGDYHITLGNTNIAAADHAGIQLSSAGTFVVGQFGRAYFDISGEKTTSGSYNYLAYAPAVNKLIINTPTFVLDYDGNVKISGSIFSTDADIGGWKIDADSIYAGGTKDTSGYTTSGMTLSANGSLHSPKTYIDSSGVTTTNISATGGTIASFTVAAKSLSSDQMIVSASGIFIEGATPGQQEQQTFAIQQDYEEGVATTDMMAINTEISSSKFYQPGFQYPACFLVGTEIATSDTSYKLIENIEVGDKVLSYDIAAKSTIETSVVSITTASVSDYYEISTERETFNVTEEHPFYVDGKWKKVRNLEINDTLYHLDGMTSNILDINHINQSTIVHHIEVDGVHNYFANKTLVHNKPGSYTVPDTANAVLPMKKNAEFNFIWDGLTTSTLTANKTKHKAIGVVGKSTGNNSGSIQHIGVYGTAHSTADHPDTAITVNRLNSYTYDDNTANYWAGWFDGNVMIDNGLDPNLTGGTADTNLFIMGSSGKDASIFLGERVSDKFGQFGHAFIHDGGDNDLYLKRYDGSTTGNTVFEVARSSDDVKFKGDVIAYSTSDKRLKKNIIRIDDAVSKISQLSGMTFEWKESKNKEYHNEREAGIIAQDVQKVLPEAVKERDDGYLAVKYEQLIPLLIEAVKEQQEQINELKSKLDKLTGNE